VLREVGAFPVARGERDPRSIRLALQVLHAGHLLGMFPEGTRSRPGQLGPFHGGAMRLAEKVGAPIVPACVVGSGRLFPRGARFPRPGMIFIRFGRPVQMADLVGPRPSPEQRAQATETVRRRVAALMRGERV
jgi:1-acyl-sn-glycerol-3-phosphate acyltransferase